ncbi:MAG TPA: cysteine--tRNA ligase [Thermomicrobiales bacterium]|nr:cysteine--tRNA ligase [Thermomicrobiales bacterium]
MALRVYNTLTQRKEDFATVEPGKVRMYVCGPTVYGPAHIGHGLSAISFDVIRRYLEYRGYAVAHAQNFTDVDDKIIARAHEIGLEPTALAEDYIAAWLRETAALNILPATIYPRATGEIGGMIAMIEGLITRGYAYPAGGDVYFRVRRFADYGKLSHRDLDELLSGARIEVGEHKEDPLDFALWKAAKPGEISWPSPWGPGRPGWHIECSVMALEHLGTPLDIHGGGADLIFPHHENEIAQSEAYAGAEPFARYWLHNGLLQLGGEKMSKSLGNLITIEELLAPDPDNGQVFRFMILTGHYRTPLTWTEESFDSARRGLERLRSGLRGYDPAAPASDGGALAAARATTAADFGAALDDDFNTAGALAALFELGRAVNRARDEGAPVADVTAAQRTLAELLGVLGLLPAAPGDAGKALAAAPFVDLLLETRAALRQAKQYALSDRIRDRLRDLGVEVEDTPAGSAWRLRG